MKLFCKDITHLPDRETIQKLSKDGQHVVLKFPKNITEEKKNIITLLKNELPENFSVFNSGGDSESEWVTIMPVIKRHVIKENETMIRVSISDYIDTCNELMKDFKTELNDIAEAWQRLQHGDYEDFLKLFSKLVDHLKTDQKISKEWHTFRHGQHIRFTNKKSEQIVEVPILGISKISQVDPYFWGEFIASTEKYNSINNLIEHTFHDSARILDYLVMKNIKE